MPFYLAIEIGGTKLQLVAGDARGSILDRRRLSVAKELGASGIRQQIQNALPELIQKHKPSCIGVGFGGPVDWKRGQVCRSHHIEGWSEFNLAGWLTSLSQLPVAVDNDANVAALGEANNGAGQNHNPVFYVTLGSGVGGGLVVDGRIYHGATPGEAEIGHVRLDRAGTTVESRCSGWAVDKKIRAVAVSEPHTLLSKLVKGLSSGEASVLIAALGSGDAAAKRILAETSQDLAFGLSHVVHLFHPQTIVLGGGLSRLGEPLRAAVEQALHGFIMEAFAPGPQISLSRLGEDAVPIGALILAAGAA